VHDQHIFEIKEFTAKATHSLRLYSSEKLPQTLLDQLTELLERHISIDLFVGETVPIRRESEPFYLYKIIGLSRDGANLYQGTQFFGNRLFLCQRDFDQIIRIDRATGGVDFFSSDDEEYKIFGGLFELNTSSEDEVNRESGDIIIELAAENKISLKNSNVSISWSVENATGRELSGLAAVEDSGTEQFLITENRIIKLIAWNQHSKKIKSIFIPVVERPQIFYDVQFLNLSSNKFVSLPEESGRGVFGVSKGNKVRVLWDVRNAEDVKVEPFDSKDHTGQVEFYTEGQYQLDITASLQMTTESKRILIQEFPVPVFKDALVDINPHFSIKECFVIDDARLRAYQFLEKRDALSYSNVSDFWNEGSHSSEQIEEMIKSQTFKRFYDEYNIEKLNKSIGERIKSYFRNEPAVLTLIKSMQKYYE
jgi:hypothetical protein